MAVGPTHVQSKRVNMERCSSTRFPESEEELGLCWRVLIRLNVLSCDD